jgi:hypothetical protein
VLTSGCTPQIEQHSRICLPTNLKKSKLARRQLSSNKTTESGERANASWSLASSAEKANPERCMPFKMSCRLSWTRMVPVVQQ